MTSSMLAGERRRASARRGGMTVLGKVAVPKPINLPSQRLENQGLDPNVEIVPKGSLSWGSRPSSSASNPWGSSVQSPSGDLSSSSPSHAGGRPSSGGSGSQPSTAGSDKMQEPFPSSWGSNSRPSSASGALTSNQTLLTSLRPRSAETRPGSSQLSRFAEHIPDSSPAWGRTGNADKLVIASTKIEGFSLTSGDFPTLGSERDNFGKDSESHEFGAHDRPRSSPDEVAAAYDRTVTSESDVKGGNTNSWKRDDTQQFMNTNMPQHFDAWPGPPINSPAGVWYRGPPGGPYPGPPYGPPGGPPYAPPVAAGGFPLEPFPHYRPKMPLPSLGNSQPVPQHASGNGPRGHHPKNGDMYRPQIPDAYMHPGMPIRPGFYPCPVPYDNYYGAPIAYNPNERDIPFMGMSAAPSVFNRFPAQSTRDNSNTHARAGGHEQVESVNSDEYRGPYKVLIKQHDDTQGEKESWENNSPGNVSFTEKGSQQRAAFHNNEWGADMRREEMHSKRTAHADSTVGFCSERLDSQDFIHSSSQPSVGTNNSRRANYGVKGRSEHCGKEMISANADVWQKKPLAAEPTANIGHVSVAQNCDHHVHAKASGMTETSLSGKDEGETLTQIVDSSDTQIKRAKSKELARQRTIQLQKEEEERIKEQKAKALSKLEELNKRSQTGGILSEKSEKPPAISGIIVDQKESQIFVEPEKNAPKNDALNPVMALSSNIVAPIIESCALRVPESAVISKNLHMDTEISEQVSTAPQTSPLKLDSVGAADTDVDSSSPKHKQTSYKKMQNIQMEKHFSEGLISFGTVGITNIHESVAVEGTVFSKTVHEGIVTCCQSTLPENSNTVREISAAQRKKSTKSGKTKNKLENPPPGSALQLQLSKQPDSNKASLESGKMKASQSEVDACSIQAVKKDVEQASEQDSFVSDGSYFKVNNQWKSQPPRRISKNGQTNQVVDRSHGNDATIWAPVRSHHRGELADEVGRKFAPDSIAVTTKNDIFGQNSVKSKRAEMERYVPKQVVKELAQQGTIQHSISSSASQTTLNETAGRRESRFQESCHPSVFENMARSVESNTGDDRQSKHTKAHGGWKHRGLIESSRLHMGSSSHSSKNIHKSMDQQESLIPEPIVSDPWDPSDGWNMPEEPTAVNASFGMKDQGIVKGKGKRQPYKGHRNMGNRHDIEQKNNNGGEIYKKSIQSAALENSQQERNATAEEYCGNGEHKSSIWKPNSQAYSADAQTGRRSSGAQHVSEEAGWGITKDPSPLTEDTSVALDKDQSKFIPQLHLEQRNSSRYRKQGNQNNRSVRGQDLREERSSGGQDNRHHSVPGNRERQPRTSHYEYQPVGPHNHGKSNNFEGPTDGSHNIGPRYRERGQGQPRRGGGNSYGRKSSAVQVDVGYDRLPE